MRIFTITLLLAIWPGALVSASGFGRIKNPETFETHRIRIHNRTGGLVQVSLDKGRTYWTVGRVIHPANARIIGFAAASYTPQGTVAAVATHGIRIKTGQSALGLGKAQLPLIFSIVPIQFATIPKGYGGHVPRSSAVITDIYAGCSIFRNQSPYVGNQVYLERSRVLEPLPEDYIPVEGDVFVIKVERPLDMPAYIEFENRPDGDVTLWDTTLQCHHDSAESCAESLQSKKVIAKVVKPVRGIGRYDGTTFTGVGTINTNHGGVITISTAPAMPPSTKEGGPIETRGGFMIQPYSHAREQNESSPQVMIIGPVDKNSPRLEGTPPLFRGYINLSWHRNLPDSSYRVQVRIDDGDWEDMPKMVGKIDDAFLPSGLGRYFALNGKPRKITRGITAFRIVFPVFRDSKSWNAFMAQDLASEAADYTRRAAPTGIRTIKGKTTLTTNRRIPRGSTLTFLVDGVPVYTTNREPYCYYWDSTTVPNGLHVIEIEHGSGSDRLVIERWEVLVNN